MENPASTFSKPVFNRPRLTRLCSDCKSPLQQRVPRSYMVKKLLFWLPIKRYRCGKCFKSVYVISKQSK